MPHEDFQREPLQAASGPAPISSLASRDIDVRKPEGGLNVVVPYKNLSALLGYYFAVFSVIPCLALILGPIAFILGILGLRYRSRNPTARGSVHAWIGVLLGGATFLTNAGVLILWFSSRAAQNKMLDLIIGQ
jgi:hypothetical protein